MPLLFAVTLFFSASLLFMVQPMVGRMVLPLLGGSSAVWNACMVFFQALLLVGYLYADRLTTRYPTRRQWAVHTVVLLVPVAAMALAVVFGPAHSPIAVADALAPRGDASPVLGVLALLTVAIGVPFFVASTSAPLLQKWFAATGHPSARDPYFLYAASNLGSLISLLGYPLLVEPNLGLTQQAWLWGGGFVALVGLIALCGRAASHPVAPPVPVRGRPDPLPAMAKPPGARGAKPAPAAAAVTAPADEPDPPLARRLRWLGLAFVPSSLMLGVTTFVTTDIVSLPLIWVIPLALYLLTFIVAFMRLPDWFRLVIGNLGPVFLLLLVFCMLTGLPRINTSTGDIDDGRTMFYTAALHMLVFFVAGLMCHYELARDRPAARHLTGYYLWMSLGGVLGGLFNALVAPLVFPLAYEYRLTLVAACAFVPILDPVPPDGVARSRTRIALDVLIPVALGGLFWVVTGFEGKKWFDEAVTTAARTVAVVGKDTLVKIGVYAVPVMACFFCVDRPARFALCVAALLAVGQLREERDDVMHTERSFFGILRVEERGGERKLVHGTTLHGSQFPDRHPRVRRYDQAFLALGPNPWAAVATAATQQAFDPRQEPLTYYHRTGPVGAMFHELRTRKGGADATADVAMVGLGTGSVSCYALPGQRLTFYEIDPAVRHLVEGPKYFTYVDDARKRGAAVDFVIGDARLRIRDNPDARYALLLVDAFSSDSIPVHLLTREAVKMYVDRLTPDGLLALHISNKFVDLEPVVGRIAADLGLKARVWHDTWGGRDPRDDDERDPAGKSTSSWVVLARSDAALGSLGKSPVDQVVAFGARNPALRELLRKYGPAADAKQALEKEFGPDKGLIDDPVRRPQALFARLRKVGPDAKLSLDDLTAMVYAGYARDDGRLLFHPPRLIDGVPAWTDDYADVLRVMTIKEVQAVRSFFGMATPIGGE